MKTSNKPNRLINTIKVNFYQAFSSKIFFLASFLTALLGVIVMQDYIDSPEITVTYLLEMFIGLSMPKKLVVLLSAMPFATSFCSDWSNHYIQPVVSRTGTKAYVLAKVVVNFSISFLVTFLGLLLALLGFLVRFPLADVGRQGLDAFAPYTNLITGPAPFFYIVAVLAIFSAASGVWSTVGLAFSAFIPNPFVTLTSALVLSYIIEEITSSFPSSLNLYLLTRSYGSPFAGALASFSYFFGIFILVSGLFGCVFYYQVNRRVKNEVI